MKINADTVKGYLSQVPESQKENFTLLYQTIKNNIPQGFQECINYGMIGFVIPHSIYPPGYHCNNKLPLPFINIGVQKNFIGLYHMGLYANAELLKWFQEEYTKALNKKPDMGKSCIRFKNNAQIPIDIIAKLSQKTTPVQWIETYESSRSQKK
ncbi:DUF1801 domain-containing protein [Aureibacter tunicatorum]|uniref:Uncharacterized protein YdhG (YjbR/CyaY superfamily) n=1 Tax=Aureibacter tunicatorum TaxID=866807 RepID=A0AAE3XQD7_9BACT|nr:DUF1801 domain-containing protein [Aureibacter tunicatorum]MDR6240119.1 uncharacterized protein YdhG (YjbR/CyaY superfamily) [Aureibacter tunicatorum]BDD06000.1 hypothetical protein AUTU_34830 [Aureibacter tunicatorum]